MANPDHVSLVKLGRTAVSEWMRENGHATLDLSGADLRGENLSGMSLHRVDLSCARLGRSDPISETEDLSGDPPGAMSTFMSGRYEPHGDKITFQRTEHGKGGGHHILPTPFIVHYTRERATDLSNSNLYKANLRGADLSNARMPGVNLEKANLEGAKLQNVDLSGACLDAANLIGVNLENSKLIATTLVQADLKNTNARKSRFERADLSRTDFSDAVLTESDLRAVNGSGIILLHADLRGADLSRAHLDKGCLDYAQLQGANLELANLVEASIEGSELNTCRAYGVSAWGLLGEAKQGGDLVITRQNEPVVTTDSLKVAQFVHLLLSDSDIRDVIDTVTSKVVLILGRFVKERKVILDSLRRELRHHNLTPVLFDFDVPADRDITETVTLLARMARFIVADLTDPASIPMELQAIAPDVAVPIRPLVHKNQEPFSMFSTLKKYHWVLQPYCYGDVDELLANLQSEVIEPAEEKRIELKVAQT